MSYVIPFSNGRKAALFPAAPAPHPTGQSIVAQVEAYWSDQRKGALVPARADINPRGIEAALPYAFVLERVAPGIARFRLAGGHLCDLMGMDVRGMPMTTLMDVEGRANLITPLEAVFQKPASARLSLHSSQTIARPAINATLALYPLTDTQGQVTRALGCLVSDSRIGRTPRRFGIEDVQVTELAKPQRPVRTERPHLRLVSSQE